VEEVLSVVSRRFGLRFFLERDGFLFRAWRGPVGVLRANHALHWTRASRRRYSWLGPVGDCWFVSGRGRGKRIKCLALIVPGWSSAFWERACLGVGCRRRFCRMDDVLQFNVPLWLTIVGNGEDGRL